MATTDTSFKVKNNLIVLGTLTSSFSANVYVTGSAQIKGSLGIESTTTTLAAQLSFTQPYYGRLNFAVPALNSRSEVRYVSQGSSGGNGQTYFVVASSELNDTGNNLLMGVSSGRVFLTNAINYSSPGEVHLGGSSWSSAGVVVVGTSGATVSGTLSATGAFSASNISGTNTGDQTTITGNAGTATTLQTARTIGLTGIVTGTATSFNGSANISIPVTAVDLGNANNTGTIATARLGSGTANSTTFLRGDNTWTTVPTATNLGYSANSLNVSVTSDTGTDIVILSANSTVAGVMSAADNARLAGTSGTNTGDQTTITGNAGTATTLQTARTIAISGAITGTATSFNGSVNITIPVTSVDLTSASMSGVLATDHGGTGITSYTPGSYINAANSSLLQQRTPEQVRQDIAARTYTKSPTAPSNPNIGDGWLNDSTGIEYTWIDDGDSGQWVDMRSYATSGPAILTYIQADQPGSTAPYTWIQTGLGDSGTDYSFWVNLPD